MSIQWIGHLNAGLLRHLWPISHSELFQEDSCCTAFVFAALSQWVPQVHCWVRPDRNHRWVTWSQHWPWCVNVCHLSFLCMTHDMLLQLLNQIGYSYQFSLFWGCLKSNFFTYTAPIHRLSPALAHMCKFTQYKWLKLYVINAVFSDIGSR